MNRRIFRFGLSGGEAVWRAKNELDKVVSKEVEVVPVFTRSSQAPTNYLSPAEQLQMAALGNWNLTGPLHQALKQQAMMQHHADYTGAAEFNTRYDNLQQQQSMGGTEQQAMGLEASYHYLGSPLSWKLK